MEKTELNTKIENKENKKINLISDITEDIRCILLNIPNKNSLYRDINLSTTYLNLKHFIAGKEKLKPRSEDALLNKLGYKKVIMYVKEDELSQEEKTYINVLQVKFLEELNEYIQKFLHEKKRFTKDEITKDEVEKIHESINQMQEYNLDLEIDGLNIDLEN
jgi:hypothetical protein